MGTHSRTNPVPEYVRIAEMYGYHLLRSRGRDHYFIHPSEKYYLHSYKGFVHHAKGGEDSAGFRPSKLARILSRIHGAAAGAGEG